MRLIKEDMKSIKKKTREAHRMKIDKLNMFSLFEGADIWLDIAELTGEIVTSMENVLNENNKEKTWISV